jgi:hypothetical protein
MACHHLGKKKIGLYVEDSKALSLPSSSVQLIHCINRHVTEPTAVTSAHATTEASTKSRHLRHSVSTSEATAISAATHSWESADTAHASAKTSAKSRHLRHSVSTSEATAISAATHSWESADTAHASAITSAKSRHLWHPITTEATAATP